MNRTITATRAIRFAITVVSIGLVAVLFLIYLDLLTQAVRVLSGMPAFFALFGMVVLGLAALVAPLTIGAVYSGAKSTQRLITRVLLVTGIQGLFFFLSEVFRRYLLERIAPGMAAATLDFGNYAVAILGLVVGCTALAIVWKKRRRGRR